MEIQVEKDVFISDLYCSYLRDLNAVVISDLHLGFEEEMNLHGLFLPKLQRSHVEGLLDRILERYDPETVFINGDFKHEFSRNLPQEWDDILHFIDRYREKVIAQMADSLVSKVLAPQTLAIKKMVKVNKNRQTIEVLQEFYKLLKGSQEKSSRRSSSVHQASQDPPAQIPQ